jgi:hypothetical protein
MIATPKFIGPSCARTNPGVMKHNKSSAETMMPGAFLLLIFIAHLLIFYCAQGTRFANRISGWFLVRRTETFLPDLATPDQKLNDTV